MISTIVVLDTETTDLDPTNGAEICEIGWVVLDLEATGWVYGDSFSTLVETAAPFAPAARANHHIDPRECQPGMNCLTRDSIIHDMLAAEVPGEMLYAAHNAPFDMKFLPELELPAIDTYQVARHLWPDAPKFSNQVLRYWLKAEPPYEFLHGIAPHRALYDAACTAALMLKALETHSPEELLRLSTTPILLKTCNFGKHANKPWAEVPTDYLMWMVRANDMYQKDAELRYTVDYYLSREINRLVI